MDGASALSSPSPFTIAGDTTAKTGTLISSSDAIMRFLNSKAGPSLLVGALIVGDSIIPLQAAPIPDQPNKVSLLLDVKNSTSLSVIPDSASCAADDKSCYSTKILLSDDGQNRSISLMNSDDNKEVPALYRRGVKSKTALGVAILAGTAIASTAVIRRVSHMGVIPHHLRKALGLPDDRSSAEEDPIVWKVTQKEIEEINRKKAKSDDKGDAAAGKREEEKTSTLLVKRSVGQEMNHLCYPSSRYCHVQGRNRLSDIFIGSLAVAGLATTAAAANVDHQIPFGYVQSATPASTLTAKPIITEPLLSSQAWQPSSSVRLMWSTEGAQPVGDIPLYLVTAPSTTQEDLPTYEMNPLVRPGSRRGSRVMRQTIVQRLPDSSDDFTLPQWTPAQVSLIGQDVSLSKRGTPAKGVKGSTVAKGAALAGVVGYVTRAWLHPPVEPVYEKRSAADDLDVEDVDLIKREPARMGHAKAAGLIGLAGLGGWLVQVNGHEAVEKPAAQQVSPGMAMVRRAATPSDGTSAERGETSLIRRCDGDDCHRQKVIITESKHGDQIKVYTKSGKELIYDKRKGDDFLPPNMHDSLRYKVAKLFHLNTDERVGVQSNSASSKIRAPGMMKLQIFFITLLSFALFASSASASDTNSQSRLVKRSPVPMLTQAQPFVIPSLSTNNPSVGAAAISTSLNGGLQHIDGWQETRHLPGYLKPNDAQLRSWEVDPSTINPNTGLPYDEITSETATRSKKAKKGSRKILQTTPDKDRYLGAGGSHNKGIGPQKELKFGQEPDIAPTPTKSSKELPGNGLGIGPDVSSLGPAGSVGGHTPPSHSKTKGASGIGPQTGITFTEGPPMAAPNGISTQSGATPSHDKEFQRKFRIAAVLAGSGLTVGGIFTTVWACRKYGKNCKGEKDAELSTQKPVFTVAEGGRVHPEASHGIEMTTHQQHHHHKDVKGKASIHHKRDLSRLLVVEESTPSSTSAFHMTCFGKDCNAELKTTKEPLWEPMTHWPMIQKFPTSQSSALQDPSTHSEIFLQKRSSVVPDWSPAPISAPFLSLTTAHTLAPDLRLHDLHNYASSQGLYKIIKESEMPKPNGVEKYSMPDFGKIEKLYAPKKEPSQIPGFSRNTVRSFESADRSRQGQTSRIRSRRVGPNSPPPKAEHDQDHLGSQDKSHPLVPSKDVDANLAWTADKFMTATLGTAGVLGGGVGLYMGGKKAVDWIKANFNLRQARKGAEKSTVPGSAVKRGASKPSTHAGTIDLTDGGSIFQDGKLTLHHRDSSSHLLTMRNNEKYHLRKRSPIFDTVAHAAPAMVPSHLTAGIAHLNAPIAALEQHHYPSYATAQDIPIVKEEPKLPKPVGIQQFNMPDFDKLEEWARRRKLGPAKDATSLSHHDQRQLSQYGELTFNPTQEIVRPHPQDTHASGSSNVVYQQDRSGSKADRVSARIIMTAAGTVATGIAGAYGYLVGKRWWDKRKAAQRLLQEREAAGMFVTGNHQVAPSLVKRNLWEASEIKSYLRKRSPMFQLATAEASAPITAHSSFNTAHTGTASAMQHSKYSSYATHHDIPIVTQKPKLPKPIGIQRFDKPDFDKLEKWAAKEKKSRARKIGPSQRMMADQKQLTMKDARGPSTFKPAFHRDQQRQLHEMEVAAEESIEPHQGSQSSHRSIAPQAPTPGLSKYAQEEVDPTLKVSAHILGGVYGVLCLSVVGLACQTVVKGALKKIRTGRELNRARRQSEADGIELAQRHGSRSQDAPNLAKRDLSFDIVGGHSLFRGAEEQASSVIIPLSTLSPRLVKRSPLPFDDSEDVTLRKRTTSLATTSAPVSSSAATGSASAWASSGSDLIQTHSDNNLVSKAGMPPLKRPSPLPPMTGETLEFYKKANPKKFRNRRNLRYYYYYRSDPSYHPDLDEPGPWNIKHAFNARYGNTGQQILKWGAYAGAFGATCGGIVGACKAASAISRHSDEWKSKIAAVGSNTKQAINRASQITIQGAKNRIKGVYNRSSQLNTSGSNHEITENREQAGHASSSTNHPSSLGLPRQNAWEKMHKQEHNIGMRMVKRNLQEDLHRELCLASGRCNLFEDVNLEDKLHSTLTKSSLPSSIANHSTLSLTSSHSSLSQALLPILSFGFALTIGSIWLTLTLSKSSQIIDYQIQSLLDSKTQDISTYTLHRPALLALPLVATLFTVSIGSIFALTQSSSQALQSSCSQVIHHDYIHDTDEVEMSKRISPGQGAAILAISAGVAATSFMAVKAVLGSTPHPDDNQ